MKVKSNYTVYFVKPSWFFRGVRIPDMVLLTDLLPLNMMYHDHGILIIIMISTMALSIYG